jgi:hypothetical protein
MGFNSGFKGLTRIFIHMEEAVRVVQMNRPAQFTVNVSDIESCPT